MTLALLLSGSHTHDWLTDTQCPLGARPVLGMDYRGNANPCTGALSQDWVLGRAHPPVAPEG